jgi:carbamoyltransferase
MNSPEYFLSVYMQAPDLTALAVMRHDNCAALWRRDGTTVTLQRYWEFERVTGLKHHRLPLRHPEDARAFLDLLLAEEGLTLGDMSEVWGTPVVMTDDDFVKRLVPAGHTAHSIAHLFSAIGMDWRAMREDTILGLAVDAGPDLQLDHVLPDAIYTGCVVRNGQLTFVPIESPGPIWLLARGLFRREEGTLMALASATTCTVALDLAPLVDGLPFWTQADVFRSADIVIERVVAVVDDALSTADGRRRSQFDDRFSNEDNRQSAVMKLLEQACFRVVDRNIERIAQEHDLDLSEAHLAICGGYALNCPNNSRLVDKYGFRSLMAPPCANDGGQALGLGVMGLYDRGIVHDGEFTFGDAFHGRPIRDLAAAIEEFAPVIESVTPMSLDQVVDDLLVAPIAWVQGEAEIGPRALGHRSILGDPRTAATKDRLNEVKQRQWWRPVAPIILEEAVGEWFTVDRRSPYMLEVFTGTARAAADAAAVLHLDGTARVQTVSPADGILYDLVSAFRHRSGVPLLGTTSLNDKGEPLVDTAAEALTFCVRKGLPVAYIDGVRVALRANAGVRMPLSAPRRRQAGLFERDARRWRDLWAEWEGLGLDPMSLFVWAWNPRLRDAIDPTSPGGARMLRIAASGFLRQASDRERRFVTHLAKYFGPDADPLVSQASDDLVGGG